MSTVKNYGVVELRSIPDEVSSRIYALPFFFSHFVHGFCGSLHIFQDGYHLVPVPRVKVKPRGEIHPFSWIFGNKI